MKIKSFLLLTLLAPSANALTGNELWSICTNKDESAPATFNVIIAASVQGIQTGLAWDPPDGKSTKNEKVPWCHPKGATFQQSSDIVIRFLNAMPEVRHMDAAVLVLAA